MTQTGWISVKERLPERYELVIVWRSTRRARMAMACKGHRGWIGMFNKRGVSAVTHWMPLPLPPTEQGERLPPVPGSEGYGGWCWWQAMKFIAELRSPDMPVHKWVEMIHKGWMDYHELVAAVAACRDINDSGEEYSHPNADGAQALANLFSMVDPPQFDEAEHENPEAPDKESTDGD